jgi:hypothetical protein
MISKRTRRTLWLLMATVILALLISLLRLPHPHWTPPVVNVVFLGFTNSGTGTEALFALTNPPAVAVTLHSVRAAAHSDRAGAKEERGSFSWGRRESWGLAYAVSVDTTNEPLRVVLEFQQRAAGPRRLIELVREVFGRLAHNDREFFTGHAFFVTNETRINNTGP